MDGRAVRAFVEDHVAAMVRDFLHEHRVRADGEGAPRVHFVPHQANGRMIGKLAADIGFPPERTHVTVGEYGNTGAASVPVTLDHAADRLAPGDLVLLAGFGGGMAAGLALVEWEPPPVPGT
jgi:3-oxoacyl-[acyl-carrier-protein] synthase-3